LFDIRFGTPPFDLSIRFRGIFLMPHASRNHQPTMSDIRSPVPTVNHVQCPKYSVLNAFDSNHIHSKPRAMQNEIQKPLCKKLNLSLHTLTFRP
jgi:hypothetical protein